jgi:hypothetical protein
MTRTKVLPTVKNLPSNDEITRFDGTFPTGKQGDYRAGEVPLCEVATTLPTSRMQCT